MFSEALQDMVHLWTANVIVNVIIIDEVWAFLLYVITLMFWL